MKNDMLNLIKIWLPMILAAATCNLCFGQNQPELSIPVEVPVLGQTKPIPVSIEGFGPEVTEILKFDLYVQGFTFVAPEAAQYHISGSSAGNVVGRVSVGRNNILSRSYNGSTIRGQAHAFSDDVVLAITGKKGIAQTRIAFKVEASSGSGEICVADFDGHNAQSVTHDGVIVAAPAWVPGRGAIYYNSYKLGNPDIFYHNLSRSEE